MRARLPSLETLEEALARKDLEAFCARMDPSYRTARHTKLLISHLHALRSGDLRKLIVAMPPRHSKTYHCGERLPAWWLGGSPRESIICASSFVGRAQDSSRAARNLFFEDRWPFPGVSVADDSSAVTRWHTNHGGSLTAAGVGGGITGFGAHLLVIDDPFKDRREADSLLIREHRWKWYTQVAYSRLMRDARQLVIMTRWHEDDLVGRILNSSDAKDWTLLRLPLFAEEDDPLGRATGEVLWPDGISKVMSSEEREAMGARAFEAMYQQRPAPTQGALFKRGWFEKTFTTWPACKTVIQTVDSAWKTGVANDYSVIATWGTEGINYYPLDVWRDKVEYPELREMLVQAYDYFRPSAVLIEDAAAGTAAIQELKVASNIPVVPIAPRGSKIQRAEAVTPIFESGRVVLPLDAPWRDAWIEEHLSFPTGAHDDQVDTTSMALERLSEQLTRPAAFGRRV